MDFGGLEVPQVEVPDVPDAAALAAAAPAVDFESLCGEALAPIKEGQQKVQDVFGETVNKPLEGIKGLKEKLSNGLPMDSVEAVPKMVTDLVGNVQKMLEDPSKLVAGPGCLLQPYIKSVTEKLGKFVDVMNEVVKKVSEVPKAIGDALKSISETLEAVVGQLGKLMEIPTEIADLIQKSMSLDGIKALAGEIGKIEEKIAEVIKGAKDSVGGIDKVLADGLFGQVGSVADTIQGFIGESPKKIVDAFKPPVPAPLQCLFKSEGKQKIEDTLKDVASKVDLQPLKDGAEGVKGAVPNFADLAGALDKLAEQIPPLLGPIKENAEKAANLANPTAGVDLMG